jgi:hypothetical protein
VPEPIVPLRTACKRGDSAGERVVQFANGVSTARLGHCVVGCFAWDPFAAQLPFTLVMMRQNAETMMEEAFASLDTAKHDERGVVVVPLLIETDTRLRRAKPVKRQVKKRDSA